MKLGFCIEIHFIEYLTLFDHLLYQLTYVYSNFHSRPYYKMIKFIAVIKNISCRWVTDARNLGLF